MDIKEGKELISSLLIQGKTARIEVVKILEENGVPKSSAYRWYQETYQEEEWETPKGRKTDEVLEDKKLAIDSIRDQLYAAKSARDLLPNDKTYQESIDQRIVDLSTALLKAHNISRRF